MIRAGGIEAVAVCFLYSHLNPIHEQQCRSAIRAVLPDIDICLSHEIDPQPREYERTVSACLEAWLRPLMKQGIATLSDGLRRQGFRGQVFHAVGTGSLIEESLARERVSHLLASGPSASARCAASTACAIGADTAIALDIGSTSADLALIDQGRLQVSRNTVYAGVPLRQWMVDVASFSLGGRSHVSCDRYGQFVFSTDTNNGHAKPTLSDALAYLGRISVVVPESAQAALVSLGRAVGKDGASAIAGDIVEAAERKLANAILDFAVRRNIDPSAVVLIAMGGLGGILGPGAARLLGMSQVAMPDAPAAAGALGLLLSEPRFDANARLGATCDTIADSDLHAVLSRLSNDAREQATRLGWQDELLLSVTVEMAVNAQMHLQYVVINDLPRSVSAITDAFKSQYVEKYGICPPENPYIFSLTVALGRKTDESKARNSIGDGRQRKFQNRARLNELIRQRVRSGNPQVGH